VIVLLDAGPLGMVTNPKSSPENEACKNWLSGLSHEGVEIVIPEIADYEVRGDLVRAGNDRGIGRLDALNLRTAVVCQPSPQNCGARNPACSVHTRVNAFPVSPVWRHHCPYNLLAVNRLADLPPVNCRF
jgi:hypothetical protein